MRLEDINPKKTACFIGDVIPQGEHAAMEFEKHSKFIAEMDDRDRLMFITLMCHQIRAAIEKGYDTFLTTLESAFEITAIIFADVVKHLGHEHIKLVYVVPHGHYGKPQNYLDLNWRFAFDDAFILCDDFVEVVKPDGIHESLDVRNWLTKYYSMSFHCKPPHLYISDDEEIITTNITDIFDRKYQKHSDKSIPS